MKTRIISLILLVLCATFILSACTMIKEPDDLLADLKAKNYDVFLYSRSDTEKFKSMTNLINLEDSEGIVNILIAEGGKDKATAKPLIIYFCSSKEATDKVFDAAKASLADIAKFTSMASETDCNLQKTDNCVIMGHAEMIKIAKVGS